MNNKSLYILPIILVGLLCGYSAWKLKKVETPQVSTSPGIERSFIWINSDSLEMCINNSYPKEMGVKVENEGSKMIIRYPKGKSVLMHTVSEGAKSDLDALKQKAQKYFECDDADDTEIIEITLKEVEDGFVYCPTALLVPLLDDNKKN